MTRGPIITLAAVGLLGLGTAGYLFAAYTDESDRRRQLQERFLVARNDATAYERLGDALRRRVREQKSELRTLRRRSERLLYKLTTATDDARSLRKLGAALVPTGARVKSVRLVRSSEGDPAFLALLWSRGDSGERGSGLHLWRASTPSDEITTSWDLGFRVHMTGWNERVIIGSPLAEDVEDTEALDVSSFRTGDATTDGRPDVLSYEGTHGSGGCGVWRVIADDGASFRQIFRRYTCESSITIRRGMLRVGSAIYPPGCSNAHGCGRRETWLRWDGASWRRVSSRVIERYPL